MKQSLDIAHLTVPEVQQYLTKMMVDSEVIDKSKPHLLNAKIPV